jgi:Pyruvate:ferredoxin oxidoreductase and related 2-oxoacid:ferredoxin oxidoreductases, beta subunit
MLELDRNNVVVVAGIGCSSRAAGYIDFHTIHSAHGRAIPFATGIKMSKPSLKVVVLTGDGDCMAIGGNHFIHAARRNIDITVIIFNNFIYGMTSGQASPATPLNSFATTAVYGTVEPPFDICKVAQAAGATYVARGTSFHAKQLPVLIADAISNPGFSVVEVLCGCPTHFGKLNKIASPVELLQMQRNAGISVKDASLLTKDQIAGKFLLGELHREERPEYTATYSKLFERVYGAKTI